MGARNELFSEKKKWGKAFVKEKEIDWIRSQRVYSKEVAI